MSSSTSSAAPASGSSAGPSESTAKSGNKMTDNSAGDALQTTNGEDMTGINDFQYVVSAQKPTAVSHSAVGNFTDPGSLDLILVKCSRLEVHTVAERGLQPIFDAGLYGRVSKMDLIRPKVRFS